MSDVEFYDAWDELNSTPPRLRQGKLDQWYGDDEEAKNSLLAMVSISSDPKLSADIFSSGINSYIESHFDPLVLLNKIVGNYTLKKYINDGGMGYVFYAERTDGLLINQSAAIKVVKPHLIDIYNYDLIDREANIMAQLKHKYIGRVIDVGTIQHDALFLPCYIMDYIEGENITEHFAFSDSLESKVTAILKVADALDFSHSGVNQYLHADIKPENILMDKHGDPVLCDFGIAQSIKKVPGEKAKRYAAVFSSAYSSPELKNNQKLTKSSDVYSLALVLYELVTHLKLPMDIGKNLPSHYVSISPANHKYTRWLKEFDAIILKATQPNLIDRFSTVKEFSHELRAFLALGNVSSYKNNLFYKLYKYLYLKPIHATVGLTGAIATITVLSVFSLSSQWFKQQQINSDFLYAISDVYAHYYENNNEINITQALTVLNEYSAGDELIYKHAMSLAKIAFDNGSRFEAKQAYAKALLVSNSNNKALTLALYAKSLLALDEYEEANNIIEPLFNKLALSDFNDIGQSMAYLELFETDVSYIAAKFDDQRTDLELLKQISSIHAGALPSRYESLLKYHQATELFYFYDGSNISPSDGVSSVEHERFLLKTLLNAKEKINQALAIEEKNTLDKELFFIKNTNLKARILYELGEYATAKKFTVHAVNRAIEKLKDDNPLIKRSYRNQYAVYRLLDLKSASQSIKNATSYDSWIMNDYWMLDRYLLGLSYLYLGDFKSAEQQVNNAFSFFEEYKKGDSLIGFVGLDSVRVLLNNYLEFTSFDRDNPLFKKTVETLHAVMVATKKIDPDMVSDYELKMTQLYLDFSGQLDDVVAKSINDVIAARSKSTGYEADDLSRMMLNMAMISYQLDNQNELVLELAKRSEALMVWSELEKTHSPDKMSIYLQLSNIYLDYGKNKKYKQAMIQAEMVYSTHYDVLKDSVYAPYFNQKFQLSLISNK